VRDDGHCSDSRHWLEAGSEIPDRHTDSLLILTYEPAAEQRICLRPNTEPILGNPICWAQLKGTPLVHTTAAWHTLVCTHTLQKLQRCFRTAERHKRYKLRPQQFTQKISKFCNTAKAICCTPSKAQKSGLSPANAVSNQRSNIRSFSGPSLPANVKTQLNHAVQKTSHHSIGIFCRPPWLATLFSLHQNLLPKQMIGSPLITWHQRWTTIACESNRHCGAHNPSGMIFWSFVFLFFNDSIGPVKYTPHLQKCRVCEKSSRVYGRGHQCGACGHQVARGPILKITFSMINVFTLTNINTTVIENKMSKTFSWEVRIKLVALHVNRYTRSSLQFQKGWWPLVYGMQGIQPQVKQNNTSKGG